MATRDPITPTTLATMEARLAKLEAALLAEFPKGAKLLVAGADKPVVDFAAEVHELRLAYSKARELEASFHEAVKERDAKHPTVKQLVVDFEVALENRFGRNSAKLEKFGYRPKKKSGAGRRAKTDAPAATPEKGAEKPAA